MKKINVLIIGFLYLTCVLTACGGGGGGGDGSDGSVAGDPDLAKLEGPWFGTYVDSSGYPHTITGTFDSSGNFTGQKVDGMPIGETTKVGKKTDTIFTMVDSNGVRGFFAIDSQARHGGFVDEDAKKGVLQKDASALPPYSVSDIDGQWSGNGFQFNSNMDIVLNLQSTVSITNLVFSVKDNLNTGFSGNFDHWIPIHGVWFGPYNLTLLGEEGPFTALLSPDKSFAMTYCVNTYGGSFKFPRDFRFRFLSRQ